MSQVNEKSPIEAIKEGSAYLRGAIAADLADGKKGVSKETVQLLKHHGTYQQDDRDARRDARAAGETGKAHIFMVRTRIPGGRLTSGQLLAELDLCDQLGSGTLRVTSRQGLQLHGVLKTDLREAIRRINALELTTLGACGDVNRNVMCCPAPYGGSVHREIQTLSQRLAEHFAPHTRAYRELWLQDPATGEKHPIADEDCQDEPEPIYGRAYLPRKFKMAVGLADDNCVDLYTHDLGFLAVVRNGEVVGYNVVVGGGMGMTPSVKKTFPAVAKRFAFTTPDDALRLAEAVVRVQRDHGNRGDRKQARLKYLIHNWGLEAFRVKVEEYYGGSLAEPTEDDVQGFDDHLGWDEQGDGRWFYGLNIENGRIQDNERMQLKSALRAVCTELQPGIRLTAHQSILLTDVTAPQRLELESILRDHQVPLSEDISTVRRWSMACVAWPTCGLAITESERALPGIIDQLEGELARLGLARDVFTVRMTGCPNGCARPYNADVGLVGKARNKYTIYLGGRRLGDRLNFLFCDMVPIDEIVPLLIPVLIYFKQERRPGETFGDFCYRKGPDDLSAWVARHHSEAA